MEKVLGEGDGLTWRGYTHLVSDLDSRPLRRTTARHPQHPCHLYSVFIDWDHNKSDYGKGFQVPIAHWTPLGLGCDHPSLECGKRRTHVTQRDVSSPPPLRLNVQ